MCVYSQVKEGAKIMERIICEHCQAEVSETEIVECTLGRDVIYLCDLCYGENPDDWGEVVYCPPESA